MTHPTPTPFSTVPFRPPLGLSGPHAQTIVGHLARPRLDLPVRRRRLDLADGDFVDLDILECGEGPDRGTPAASGSVLILHGLEGSSERSYVRILMYHLRAMGLASIALNFRGCSGEPNRLARTYHSGDTADVSAVIDHLHRSRAGPVAAAGFSLGGNVLLKYLGERGSGSGLTAAVAISVPYDLQAAAGALTRGFWGRIYSGYFLGKLKRKIEAKRALLPPVLVASGLAARTLEAFDEAVTAPLHGFEGAADYYAKCSAARFLGGIHTPSLLLQALDDPFLPRNAIPLDRICDNPSLTMVATGTGGHLGFLRRRGTVDTPRTPPLQADSDELEASRKKPMLLRFWAEREAARFLASRMTSLLAG